MAFDVSALTDFVKEDANKANLIAATLVSPKTAKLIKEGGSIHAEVKSSEKIGRIETDAVLQANTGCGFNASGTTTLSQRTLTVGSMKVEEALCPRSLEAKYTQQALSKGSEYDTVAFAKWWSQRKIDETGVVLETAIWQGDTASGTANLNKFDGFQKIIAAASDEIDANVAAYFGSTLSGAGAITSTNVDEVMDAIFKALPSALLDKDDTRVFCGLDIMRLAMIAFRNSNYFHYKVDEKGAAKESRIYIPGTNVVIEGVAGLNGTQDLYALRLSNMHLGTDLLGEETDFKLWYSQDDDNVKYSNKFKYGVQVGVTNEIVKFVVS